MPGRMQPCLHVHIVLFSPSTFYYCFTSLDFCLDTLFQFRSSPFVCMTLTNIYDVTYDKMMHIFNEPLWTRLIFDHVMLCVAFILPCLVVVPLSVHTTDKLQYRPVLIRRRHAI